MATPDNAQLELARVFGNVEAVSRLPAELLPGAALHLARLAVAVASSVAELQRSPNAAGGAAMPGDDESLISLDEAGAILGVQRRWFYRHGKLPFIVKLSRKNVRVSEPRLRRWMARQGRLQYRGIAVSLMACHQRSELRREKGWS